MSYFEPNRGLQFTKDEREELLWLLDRTLEEARVEERRAMDHEFREHVKREETVLRNLIQKLRATG